MPGYQYLIQYTNATLSVTHVALPNTGTRSYLIYSELRKPSKRLLQAAIKQESCHLKQLKFLLITDWCRFYARYIDLV